MCNKCKKLNHFAIACRNKKVNEIDDCSIGISSDSDNSFVLESVSEVNILNSERKETVFVNNSKILLKVNTGSEANIIPVSLWQKICVIPEIKKTYTGHDLKVLGTCKC